MIYGCVQSQQKALCLKTQGSMHRAAIWLFLLPAKQGGSLLRVQLAFGSRHTVKGTDVVPPTVWSQKLEAMRVSSLPVSDPCLLANYRPVKQLIRLLCVWSAALEARGEIWGLMSKTCSRTHFLRTPQNVRCSGNGWTPDVWPEHQAHP